MLAKSDDFTAVMAHSIISALHNAHPRQIDIKRYGLNLSL